MNELRLILIFLGIVIVLGLYVTGRRNKKPQSVSPDQPLSQNQPVSQNRSSVNHSNVNHRSAAGASNQPITEISEAEQLPQVIRDIPDSFENDEQMQALLQEYDEEVDWDNLDDMETEWLEESADDINYDQLMVQLNQGQAGSNLSEYGGGYLHSHSRPGEKMFVSVRKPDARKVNQAVRAAQQVEPLVLVMHVLATKGGSFSGSQIQSAMKTAGLSFGEMQLFHAYTRASNNDLKNRQQRVFSVVNAVEPGHFDRAKLDSLRTPGISLLLQLPGPIDNSVAFDWFYRTGKELAQKLDGVLCDESRNLLTQQGLNHMKDRISDFNLKLQLSQHPSIH